MGDGSLCCQTSYLIGLFEWRGLQTERFCLDFDGWSRNVLELGVSIVGACVERSLGRALGLKRHDGGCGLWF